MGYTPDEVRTQALRLFCQHCQALRKTFGWETEEVCWAERWFDEDSAICASAQDAINGFLAIPELARACASFDALVKALETALDGWTQWVESELEGTSYFKPSMAKIDKCRAVLAKAKE